jgi:hypothetical protein
MTIRQTTATVGAIVLAWCAGGLAGPTAYKETWTASSNVQGWERLAGGAPTWDASGNPGGSLLHSFSVQSVPEPEEATLFADADGAPEDNFVGDLTTPVNGTWNVRFSMDTEDHIASSVYVYFYSDTTGNTWKRYLEPPSSTNSWTNYPAVPLEFGPDWILNSGGGTQVVFENDLNDVDRLGVAVLRGASTIAQDTFVDNFELLLVSGDPQGSMFKLR